MIQCQVSEFLGEKSQPKKIWNIKCVYIEINVKLPPYKIPVVRVSEGCYNTIILNSMSRMTPTDYEQAA